MLENKKKRIRKEMLEQLNTKQRTEVFRAINSMIKSGDGKEALTEMMTMLDTMNGVTHRMCSLERDILFKLLDDRDVALNNGGKVGNLKVLAAQANFQAWSIIRDEFEVKYPNYRLISTHGRLVIHLKEG
jgi:hypothetical protein